VITLVPALSVLAVVAAGLVAVSLSAWQTGVLVIGVGLLLGAGLRLSLPARSAGLLVVRSRPVDAAVLLVLGFALVLLASTVPTAS
jgi:Protein of unknown function (DUF3017)